MASGRLPFWAYSIVLPLAALVPVASLSQSPALSPDPEPVRYGCSTPPVPPSAQHPHLKPRCSSPPVTRHKIIGDNVVVANAPALAMNPVQNLNQFEGSTSSPVSSLTSRTTPSDSDSPTSSTPPGSVQWPFSGSRPAPHQQHAAIVHCHCAHAHQRRLRIFAFDLPFHAEFSLSQPAGRSVPYRRPRSNRSHPVIIE